ncbi:family 43 glycosylhydrolase [Saccharicrinis sp. FJH62]|uniref:family 43 glycosylhydrolase n=1 Tax=Saccharicrinis sp. FJH62 TaxID=3344657 RepID=UPI0035D4056F
MKINIILTFIILSLLNSCNTKKQKEDKSTLDISGTYYENPVLGGDYPDPSVFRDGEDYYMTHSSFEYYPGLLIWHSKDLIHWERIAHALHKYVGSVWAPDFLKFNNRYYIYFPAGGTNWVVTADSPAGPWSEPIDLNLRGFIDPGHMVDAEGNRYLYLSKGFVVGLSEDGLSVIGEPKHIYDGWQFPKEWSTECFCLESPKLTVKNEFYYLTVAEGGTAGPATAHMVVSARSKSPFGPFENSPYNPVVHTENRDQRWWCQGHGTLVDDTDGNWWIMYHGYEKCFQTLGRQTLMLPVVWTDDLWFKVPDGINSSDKLKLPTGKALNLNSSLSDNFSADEPGLQWQFYKDFDPDRIKVKNGKLVMSAKGRSFDDTTPFLVNASDRKYEVTVEYNLIGDAISGLCLYYNKEGNMRIEVSKTRFTVYNRQNAKIREPNTLGNHGYLKILNDENEISFYFSGDGQIWTKVERSIDATGFNHNVFGGFMSLRPGIYSYGTGDTTFDNFTYTKL